MRGAGGGPGTVAAVVAEAMGLTVLLPCCAASGVCDEKGYSEASLRVIWFSMFLFGPPTDVDTEFGPLSHPIGEAM